MINELIYKGTPSGVESKLIKSRTVNKIMVAMESPEEAKAIHMDLVYRDDNQSVTLINNLSLQELSDISDLVDGYSSGLQKAVEGDTPSTPLYFGIRVGSITLTDDAQLELKLKGTATKDITISLLQGATAPLKVYQYEKILQSNINFKYPREVYVVDKTGKPLTHDTKDFSVVVKTESNQGQVDLLSILANTFVNNQVEFRASSTVGLLYNLNTDYEIPEIVNVNCSDSAYGFIGVSYVDISTRQLQKVEAITAIANQSKVTSLAQKSPQLLQQVVARKTASRS